MKMYWCFCALCSDSIEKHLDPICCVIYFHFTAERVITIFFLTRTFWITSTLQISTDKHDLQLLIIVYYFPIKRKVIGGYRNVLKLSRSALKSKWCIKNVLFHDKKIRSFNNASRWEEINKNTFWVMWREKSFRIRFLENEIPL